MKYCKKCKVKVNSPVARCPLCYATLAPYNAEPEPLCYPDNTYQATQYNLVLRILLFLSLSAVAICFTVDFFTGETMWWSFLVAGGAVYIWLAMFAAMQRHRKLGFHIMAQGLLLGAFIFLLDLFFGDHTWILDYLLPGLFLIASLASTIIVIIQRMAIRDFLLHFILTALMGFIPLVLVALGLVDIVWPSFVSALYSALALVSIFIFADNATKIELKKRFHI